MVSLSTVHLSNAQIPLSLPTDLVGVFVGATNGIGAAALKQFVKHARRPRAYFIGRKQEAGDRIAAECKELNPEGQYIFIKADCSLIRVVDDICRDIKSKEKAVNILFLTMGTLVAHTVTTENLHFAAALVHYSRLRFILNLLPLLQQAPGLRRVVSVLAAGYEGPIETSDFQGLRSSLMSLRGHASSLITLSLEAVAKKAPDVSFIHDFPGSVKSGILDDLQGVLPAVMRAVSWVVGRWTYMPTEECGERQLFLATSARYGPARTSGEKASGVDLVDGVAVARGTNGESGSGVYSVDAKGESSGPKVEKLLAKFREEGMVEQVMKNAEDEYKRITGLEHI